MADKIVRLALNDGWWSFSPVIHGQQNFDCNGTLRGVKTAWPEYGRLPSSNTEFYEKLRADSLADRVAYVVYSYATPITYCDIEGKWHKNQWKYSVTTTRHQGVVFTAIDNVREA